MTTIPPPASPDNYHQLQPRQGEIFVVRWVRRDGRDVKHKYYRRRSDAHAFADRLNAIGRPHAIFVADATWRPEPTA